MPEPQFVLLDPFFGGQQVPKKVKEEFAKDFNQKYADTFLIGQLGNAPKELLYVRGALPEDDPYSNTFHIEYKHTAGGFATHPFLDFHPIEGIPKSQYFNLDGTAYFAFRKPERQWKRGLCHGTVAFVEGSRAKHLDDIVCDLRMTGLSPVLGSKFRDWANRGAKLNITTEVARKLLLPESEVLPSYGDCCNLVRTFSKDIQAFHPHYAVAVDWWSPNLVLLHDRIAIAEIDIENPNNISVRIPMFLQEVRDLFRKLRIDVIIKQKVL